MQILGRPMLFNDGYIYFAQMDHIGPIKIGYTKNVKKRLASLQTGSPYKLSILCIMPGTESFENIIHVGLDEIRLEGEWFLPHPFLLHEIDLINASLEKHPISKCDFKNEELP